MRRKMHVMQLISSGGYFGAENVLVQLADALHQKPLFSIVSGVLKNMYNPHVEVADECKKRGIPAQIFPCRGKLDPQTILQIRKFLTANQIEIIHSHGYKSNIYAYFSSVGLQVRRFATCHNWLGDDAKMKFYAVLDRFFLRQFDRVIAVSPDVKKKILASGIPEKKVTIIRNGIGIEQFAGSKASSHIRQELGIPQENTVVGTVGRLSQEKGHRHLLNIVPAIAEKFHNVTFLIVGDGNLKAELQTKYSHPAIIFTGFRRDLPELYKSMDIFVLPSLTEGLPMVLLEAMASQLPVVASNVGAVPEVLIDGKTGFLVEPGDEGALLEKIVKLLDADLAQEMGRYGRERVKSRYSSESMAEEYAVLYREMTTSGGGR